jgi:hypothetical protein
VVEPARLSGPEDEQAVADVVEGDGVALEEADLAEGFVRRPRRVADVDHEPALGGGPEAVLRRLQARFLDHGL